MDRGRRKFLSAAVPAAVCAGVALVRTPFTQQGRPPEHSPQLPAPGTAGTPKENLPVIDSKRLLKQNQKQIQEDVQQLLKLAQELKDQVGDTDSAAILSLPLIHKAEEIEKLAKQIKNLARG